MESDRPLLNREEKHFVTLRTRRAILAARIRADERKAQATEAHAIRVGLIRESKA